MVVGWWSVVWNMGSFMTVFSYFSNWGWVVSNWGWVVSNWSVWYYFSYWSGVVSNWSLVMVYLWFSVVYLWSSNDFVYWGNDFVYWGGGYNFVAWWFTTYDSVETVVIIGGIFDNTVMTISIIKAVRSMYNISVTGFLLLFNVTGFGVMDGVAEVVFWWSFMFVFNMFVDWGGNGFNNWSSVVDYILEE